MPGTTSYAENVIRALGKAAGDRVLGKTQRILDRLAKRGRPPARPEQATLRIRAGTGTGTSSRTPTAACGPSPRQPATRTRSAPGSPPTSSRGSRRHRRLPEALRRVPVLVFVADALLLLYFFSGVTNVDWASPLSAALVFAVLLAAMVTGISFAFFRFTGDRLQQYKNDAGTIPLRGLDEATTVSRGWRSPPWWSWRR